MPRLPAIQGLAETVRRATRGKVTVGESADFLVEHRGDLALFEDMEHLALSTDAEYALPGTTEAQIETARRLGHHLVAIRAALAQELWTRQIFVDTDVLDELLYWAVRHPDVTDPVYAVVKWIRDARVNRPGLILFPLHSFGILGAGLIRQAQGRITFTNQPRGYALTPQTNDLDRTQKFLDEVARAFGARKAVDVELINHWHRSRGADWLERNPLLAIRTVQLPGSYYGNEWLLMTRLKATTGLLCMLAALQPPAKRANRLFSSRTMNNWQTLDIYHYITLYDNPNRAGTLDGHCVPIHASRIAITEMANLDIDIDPRHWARNATLGERVHDANEAIYTAYLRQRIAHGRDNAHTRTVRKMFDAIGFFRRAHEQSPEGWRSKVSLATAFELLLTDSFGGVRVTLQRRTRLLLRGVAGTRAMQRAVGDLYVSRSEIVHAGKDDAPVDMAAARKAFVLCFVALAERLDTLSPRSEAPVRDLTGDTFTTTTTCSRD